MSSPGRPVTDVRAVAVRADRHLEVPERVATEEPMEIRAAGPGQPAQPVSVTMRTPGHDFELAVGFLVTEGLIARTDVAAVGYCDAVEDAEARWNTVTVSLRHPWLSPVAERHFTVTSSCGICGKASLDQVALACPVLAITETVAGSLISRLPDRLRAAQRVFDQTGGLHAAGLFDRDGRLLSLREDVGRHNAVDKTVGHLVLAATPLAPAVLMVSGRVSFEIVQKAAMAGLGVVAAVSAPSSLAVSAAARLGVTLAGFVRGGTYNVYTHPERLDLDI